MTFSTTQLYPGPIRAVIFDLAGTTVDFGSCAPAGAFVELFARHDVEITSAEARGPMGIHKLDHIRAITAMPSVIERWAAEHGHPPSEDDVTAMYDEFIPLQLDCLPRFSDLIPGTLEAVASLRGMGVKIGATTGYNREMLEVVLSAAKEQGFVPDAASCAGDVPSGRPAPWMLFRVLEELGVYPPAAAVAVGDTIPDIDAGLNAGMWTIGVAKTGNMLGLTRGQADSLAPVDLADRLAKAREELAQGGAHAVVDGIESCPETIAALNAHLAEDGGS